jgi:hypothetical protein
MSALPPKADIVEHHRQVRFAPKADIGFRLYQSSRAFLRKIKVLPASICFYLPSGTVLCEDEGRSSSSKTNGRLLGGLSFLA